MLAGELHLAELVADHELLDGGQRDGLGDRLDVEAVTGVGGNPPSRRVRVGQQAARLEVGEDVPNRSARYAQPVALDERLRPNRDRRRHVFLDDGPEDRFCAGVQRAAGAPKSSRQGPLLLVGDG